MKWQGLVLLSTYVYLILQGNAAPLECNYADIVRNHLRLQTGQGSQTRNSRLWDAFKDINRAVGTRGAGGATAPTFAKISPKFLQNRGFRLKFLLFAPPLVASSNSPGP